MGACLSPNSVPPLLPQTWGIFHSGRHAWLVPSECGDHFAQPLVSEKQVNRHLEHV